MKATVLCALQILYLEVELETLTEQLHRPPEVSEGDENGRMTGDDLDQIQKHNRELEQQLADKNRVSCVPAHVHMILASRCRTCLRFSLSEMTSQTIKQLQQRMAELKRTLQKELVRLDSAPFGSCSAAAFLNKVHLTKHALAIAEAEI